MLFLRQSDKNKTQPKSILYRPVCAPYRVYHNFCSKHKNGGIRHKR